jgi:1,4-alpha-glucan branching enzyme
MPNTKSVSFRLDAPEAKSVAIAGDFNQWNQSARPLKQRKDGCGG